MLIVDEFLSEKLEWSRDHKDQVWRIAGLNDGKTALTMDLHQQSELMKKRGRIFPEIRERPPPLWRQGMPVDRDLVDDLVFRRKGSV